MSEAELFESMYMASGNGLSTLAIFFTLVGSYIVAAYRVGEKLTSTQVRIINTLFILSTSVATASVWAYFLAGARFQEALLKTSPFVLESDVDMHLAVIVAVVVCLISIVGGLKFMWDIRRGR